MIVCGEAMAKVYESMGLEVDRPIKGGILKFISEKDEIPVVNVGTSVRYHIKKGKRPKEVYIRITQAILEDIGSAKYREERFLDWLFKEVLPSLEK